LWTFISNSKLNINENWKGLKVSGAHISFATANGTAPWWLINETPTRSNIIIIAFKAKEELTLVWDIF
jgi:hypothetical protein